MTTIQGYEILVIEGILFLIMTANVLIDNALISKNISINHLAHASIVGAVVLFILSAAQVSEFINRDQVIMLAGTFPSLRWLVHDFALNTVRDKSFFYLGDPPSSMLDKFLVKVRDNLGERYILVVKVWAFVISLLIIANLL